MTSGKVATTIGYERLYNPSLRFTDLGPFVEHMLRDQPLRPANMENIVAINQGRRPYSAREPQLEMFAPQPAEQRTRDGCMVVDARSIEAFGAGHVLGAYHIPASSGRFEQNAGWILPIDRPFLLATDSAEQAHSAARKLAFLGLDQRVAGWLDPLAWVAAGLPVGTLPQMDVHALDNAVRTSGMQVLDVRETEEWRSGRIGSARHLSFKRILGAWEQVSLRPDRPLAVLCASGARSSTACSLLRQLGFEHLWNVSGGMQAWERAGLPVERG